MDVDVGVQIETNRNGKKALGCGRVLFMSYGVIIGLQMSRITKATNKN
jgi:hypothetical protein